MTQKKEKKKISRFEFAIAQAAGPEVAKDLEPYTEEEELKQREENLSNQAKKLIKKKAI